MLAWIILDEDQTGWAFQESFFDFCKAAAAPHGDISVVGSSWVEIGKGQYILDNPNVTTLTGDAICNLTISAGVSAVGVFSAGVEISLTPQQIQDIADAINLSMQQGDIRYVWTEYEEGHDGELAYAVKDVTVMAYNNNSATGNPITSGLTDEVGEAPLFLNAGTYFLFRRKAGRDFDNPVQIEVS